MGELKQKASRYSDVFEGAPPLADEALRARKAAKIQAVLAEEGMFDRAGIRILDIGCSFGIILKALTPADGLGVGIDIDRNLGSRPTMLRPFAETPNIFRFRRRLSTLSSVIMCMNILTIRSSC